MFCAVLKARAKKFQPLKLGQLVKKTGAVCKQGYAKSRKKFQALKHGQMVKKTGAVCPQAYTKNSLARLKIPANQK